MTSLKEKMATGRWWRKGQHQGGLTMSGSSRKGLRDLNLATHDQYLPHMEVRVVPRPKEMETLPLREDEGGLQKEIKKVLRG